jgi:hypothetical protein
MRLLCFVLFIILLLFMLSACAAPTVARRSYTDGSSLLIVSAPSIGGVATASMLPDGTIIVSSDTREGWHDLIALKKTQALVPVAAPVSSGLGGLFGKVIK